jgi:hypothetical protein
VVVKDLLRTDALLFLLENQRKSKHVISSSLHLNKYLSFSFRKLLALMGLCTYTNPINFLFRHPCKRQKIISASSALSEPHLVQLKAISA